MRKLLVRCVETQLLSPRRFLEAMLERMRQEHEAAGCNEPFMRPGYPRLAKVLMERATARRRGAGRWWPAQVQWLWMGDSIATTRRARSRACNAGFAVAEMKRPPSWSRRRRPSSRSGSTPAERAQRSPRGIPDAIASWRIACPRVEVCLQIGSRHSAAAVAVHRAGLRAVRVRIDVAAVRAVRAGAAWDVGADGSVCAVDISGALPIWVGCREDGLRITKIGAKAASVMGALLLGSGYVCMLGSERTALWMSLALLIAGHSVFRPALHVRIASVIAATPHERERGFLWHYLAANLGYAAGGWFGEWAHRAHGWNAVFVGAAIACAVAGGL